MSPHRVDELIIGPLEGSQTQLLERFAFNTGQCTHANLYNVGYETFLSRRFFHNEFDYFPVVLLGFEGMVLV